jgi:hypothetical protein
MLLFSECSGHTDALGCMNAGQLDKEHQLSVFAGCEFISARLDLSVEFADTAV